MAQVARHHVHRIRPILAQRMRVVRQVVVEELFDESLLLILIRSITPGRHEHRRQDTSMHTRGCNKLRFPILVHAN